MCKTLDNLLYRLRYWRISVNLNKSAFGKRSIDYLSHEINREGIRATPKSAKSLSELAFPVTLKGMQSFLGSLNYYGKFIEGYASIASVLYELTDEQLRAGHDLGKAKLAFQLLKDRLLAAPILRHPNRDKPFVVILHANDWAVGAVLAQEYDGILHPVRFTSRTLHDAELRYHIAEKEVLALLRVLSTFYTIVAGSPVKVYTRYSVLRWLMTSKSVTGRCLQWATLLSPWTLEIQRIEKDEDRLASLLAGSITPREVLDRLTSELEPEKSRRAGTPVVSIEMLDEGHVITFDGAAKLKTKVGSASYVL
ncbi:hypothetical protein ATCC90586_011072 [Pythium insidiosum]|nr:hypothetical protein ATCC90586_011072 [Pythium insidiosum]